MTPIKTALLCSLASLTFAGGNALACYTVYDSSNTVVYNAQTPPVDTSLPLHETLPQRFPGGHLVKSESMDCPRVQAAAAVIDRTPGTAPLLTDRRTADAMNLPYTVLSSGAALVQPERNPTATMGAGPVMLKPVTVITEMHNPPLVDVRTSR